KLIARQRLHLLVLAASCNLMVTGFAGNPKANPSRLKVMERTLLPATKVSVLINAACTLIGVSPASTTALAFESGKTIQPLSQLVPVVLQVAPFNERQTVTGCPCLMASARAYCSVLTIKFISAAMRLGLTMSL